MLRFSLSLTLFLNFWPVSYSAPSPNFPTLTRREAPPLSTACGDVVRNASENTFKAGLVYDCLTSVPFHPEVASKFLKYYTDSVQFHSSIEYLKNPPAGYQQPATDLLGNLELIQGMINTRQFDNQYEFEAALQSVVYAAHDDHLSLSSGILGVFSFGTSYRIVSLSKDGIELPKVYLSADILLSLKVESFEPSPIVKLNGKDAVEYLTHFAAKNAVGGRESHTDWNSLMINPAQVVQGIPSVWGGGATFYPGETLTIELLNGTVVKTPWYGVFHGDSETGPLETGGDFYNSFVLGYLPASYEEEGDEVEDETIEKREEASATSEPVATPTKATKDPVKSAWNNIAYPKPDLAQNDLGLSGGGFLSAYFLEESSIAVLSVPAFQEPEDAIEEYSAFVGKFIKTSKQKKMKKVVIDLQRNFGGDALLATDMFKQFFPTKEKDPFGGSRLRAHGAANILGKTLTDYWLTTTTKLQDYYYLYSNEWVAPTRINAETNKKFKSWEEFYGPHEFNGGSFTTTQRYDLSDALFDTMATGSEEAFVVYGYGARPATTKQEYAAEDIILLTDGICSSTCSLFVEMMHGEAGVRTVVVGGRPFYGPMQAVGLSRGAIHYGIDTQLDSDIEDAKAILDFLEVEDNLLPGREDGLDVEVYFAGVNLRDQIRKGDDTPLQFKYDAADCRIFFTPKSIFNYVNLWQHAADAIWTRPELCVKDSTGYATTDESDTKLPPSNVLPESSEIETPALKFTALITSFFDADANIDAGPKDKVSKTKAPPSFVGQDCTKDPGDSSTCPKNYYCDQDYAFCSKKTPGKKISRAGCVKMCQHYVGLDIKCKSGGTCRSLPELDPSLQLDDTSRGFCSTPIKAKKFKCTAEENTKVKPGEAQRPGKRNTVRK